MQSLLFVLGPFIALSGIGLGALWVAFSFITHVLVPKKRQIEAQTLKTLEMNDYVYKANCLVNDIVIESGRSVALPAAVEERLYELRALPASDKIATIPSKYRRAIGETQ